MIHKLCASCGRNPEQGFGRQAGAGIHVGHPGGRTQIVRLCNHCADPARFSVDQLADAIIAEFARQLSPTHTKGTPK